MDDDQWQWEKAVARAIKDEQRRWEMTGMIGVTEESFHQFRSIAEQRTAIGIPTTVGDLTQAMRSGWANPNDPKAGHYVVRHEGLNRRQRRDIQFGRKRR